MELCTNSKGSLVEFCQKHKDFTPSFLTMPIITSTGFIQDFQYTITLVFGNQDTSDDSSPNKRTKVIEDISDNDKETDSMGIYFSVKPESIDKYHNRISVFQQTNLNFDCYANPENTMNHSLSRDESKIMNDRHRNNTNSNESSGAVLFLLKDSDSQRSHRNT